MSNMIQQTTRPQNLADVAVDAAAGGPFGVLVREFLDYFASLTSDVARATSLMTAPAILNGRVPGGAMMDAYLAAVAEKLSWDRHMETPEWAYGSERFLSEPWFAASDTPGLRPLLLLESPVMFRRRNLFVSINALERARR
jgi:hypothetical protein